MLLLTQIRAKKLFFCVWLWARSCRVSVDKMRTKSSSACWCATVVIGSGCFGWKWQMFSKSSSLRFPFSGVTALSVNPPHANQNGYSLCKPSNISGNKWKWRNHFCPQKHADLQRGAGWACWFVEIEMFSGGISISLMFQLKPSSICFETCQPGLFLHPGCPVLAQPWETCCSEAWLVNGELKIWASHIQGPWLLIFTFRWEAAP